ncbi:hypothetical protein QR680_011980 [Steinernema hermaphroditum]|uniref:Uncharacterized protein n=1 Tax=Steinernema hermaphroditum TaxID=289476 RepID=A0AA39LZX3_9BILA|nr:hypothetical protein QR680_011980 [Steinernema hermaphroditum]
MHPLNELSGTPTRVMASMQPRFANTTHLPSQYMPAMTPFAQSFCYEPMSMRQPMATMQAPVPFAKSFHHLRQGPRGMEHFDSNFGRSFYGDSFMNSRSHGFGAPQAPFGMSYQLVPVPAEYQQPQICCANCQSPMDNPCCIPQFPVQHHMMPQVNPMPLFSQSVSFPRHPVAAQPPQNCRSACCDDHRLNRQAPSATNEQPAPAKAKKTSAPRTMSEGYRALHRQEEAFSEEQVDGSERLEDSCGNGREWIRH